MDKLALYKPKEFAELLGVTVKTLQRWDSAGILKARRSPTNRRYYTSEQYDEYMQKYMNMPVIDDDVGVGKPDEK